MPAEKRRDYKFDNFRLDVSKRRLLRDEKPVTLNPKAFDLLLALVEHNGELLTKDDLFRLVWNEQIVEESNLSVNMSAIRRALGEKASNPRYITTVSGRGYYFTADLNGAADEDVIVESHSMSRIVVEEEVETAEEKLIEPTVESFPVVETDSAIETRLVGETFPIVEISPDEERAALPAAPESFSKSYRTALYALPLLIIPAIIGGFFLYRQNAAGVHPFQQISIKRLTTNGRVTNAALSPDGKLFAFTQQETDGQQSLKLEHVDGSGELLLRPPADVMFTSIVFTPDGSRIVYGMRETDSGGSTIFRLPVFGGAPEKIKEDVRGYITFAPDGKQFAFVRNDAGNDKSALIVAETDGAKSEREIARRPLNLAFLTGSIAWSPNGKQIAVGAVGDENGNAQELYLVSVAGGSIKPLTKLEWNSVRALAWTRESNYLIAVAAEKNTVWEYQLYSVSASDGAARRIVSDLNVYSGVVNLSADNGALLTVQGQHYSNLWVAPADNLSAAKQITFDMLGKLTGWSGLDWLPGNRIVFTGFTGKSETLWTINADGTNQKQLLPENRVNENPSVSADGRTIVFYSNRSGADEIWRADGDGANPRQLTTGGKNSQPHIAPDGKWIVYNSSRSGQSALWRISPEGGEPVRLTVNPASWAQISPDGTLVACGMNIDGRPKLAIVSIEGGEPHQLFDVPRSFNFRLGIHWMPDGKAVTYRDWTNGIWRQDLTGGEPKRLEGLPEEKLYAYGWSRDGKQFAFTRGTEIRDVVLISNTK